MPAIRMRGYWRNLWNAIGEGCMRTTYDWSLAVLVAIRHRNDLTKIRPQRNPSDVDPKIGPLDNRIAWYAALPEIDHGMPWFSKLLRFYFSAMDGTSTVERDLGIVGEGYKQHMGGNGGKAKDCLLYTSPSPRDQRGSRMPSSA